MLLIVIFRGALIKKKKKRVLNRLWLLVFDIKDLCSLLVNHVAEFA